MKAEFILLDIDNTISDDGWRIPRINWAATDSMKRYFDYHALAPWDKPGNTDLFTGRAEAIILLTSRPVIYRAMTEHWLRRASVPYVHLLMRNNGDLRPSTAVKREQLTNLLDYYAIHLKQVACAYDDRPEIVEMYRRYGVPAEVRALHSESAYHDPATGINHADGSRVVMKLGAPT